MTPQLMTAPWAARYFGNPDARVARVKGRLAGLHACVGFENPSAGHQPIRPLRSRMRKNFMIGRS